MTYLLVDGSHLAHRCRYAEIANLTTSGGYPSGVVFGVLKGLGYARRTLGLTPSQMIVFWDGGRAKKRLEILPEYKLRVKPEQDETEKFFNEAFWYQVNAVRSALPYRGVRNVLIDGTEADDLIAIEAHRLAASGHDVVIFSGDKDMQQLVSAKVSIFHSEHGLMTERDVLTKWNLPDTESILRYRCIVGDPSDNIKGVPGVGDKRARLCVPYWDLIFNDGSLGHCGQATKWLQICRGHREILLRNDKLSRLPKTIEESFYDAEAAYSMEEQLRDSVIERAISAPNFFKFCALWDISGDSLGDW